MFRYSGNYSESFDLLKELMINQPNFPEIQIYLAILTMA